MDLIIMVKRQQINDNTFTYDEMANMMREWTIPMRSRQTHQALATMSKRKQDDQDDENPRKRSQSRSDNPRALAVKKGLKNKLFAKQVEKKREEYHKAKEAAE
ncbi:hypothetical protein DV738_g1641, partial [Chaetothyriales sp. CBS 135597]